jgi:hypothetical protein
MTNLWKDKRSGQYLLGNPRLLEYYSEKRFELIASVPTSASANGVKYVSKNDIRNIFSEMEKSVRNRVEDLRKLIF